MNRAELAAAVAEKSGLEKKDTDTVLSALLDIIAQELRDGNKVQITGFGSFEVRELPAHTGTSPVTKEKTVYPASRIPVFKAGKTLKDTVKQ